MRPQSFLSQPRMALPSGVATSTLAPAARTLSRGTSNSACSKPCVAMIRILALLISGIVRLQGTRIGAHQRQHLCPSVLNAYGLPVRRHAVIRIQRAFAAAIFVFPGFILAEFRRAFQLLVREVDLVAAEPRSEEHT